MTCDLPTWLRDENIRPYVFVRTENRIDNPGTLHRSVDWFPHDVLFRNPLRMDQSTFADRILALESGAFGPSGMAMQRWVFYDCAIVPGIVTGFACRSSAIPEAVSRVLSCDESDDWTPLSLFILVPTQSGKHGEWVANNLCSVNSLLAKKDRFHGLGFLSKAFGLWYANVRTCWGMTQWESPSIRLHSHFGDLEIVTAYTPIHSYSRTLTYRFNTEVTIWPTFFSRRERECFLSRHRPSGFTVDPTREQSLISFQKRIEQGEGPFYLNGPETMINNLTAPLTVYI